MALEPGTTLRTRLELGRDRVDAFAALSADDNPLHMDAGAARSLGFPRRVAHGALLLSEISRVIGTELPGPGSLWISTEVVFEAPAYVGDAVLVDTTVEHVSGALNIALLDFVATRESDGATLLTGSAKVKILEEGMPLSYRPLADQAVLVTGGTRGLGRAVTLSLLGAGATVLAVYRSDEGAAAALRDEAGADGDRLLTEAADITDSAAVARLLEVATEEMGRIDSLVHAASPSPQDVPLAELEWATMLDFLQTNVKGCLELVQGALPHFRASGTGRVVVVGSEAVQAPKKHWTHYVTAKGALLGMVRSLAVELAEVQATVNMVSPGTVHSSDVLPGNVKAMTRNATPLKRLVTEEEVAEVVVFLLGPGGSFMSGAHLPMTGGRLFFS